MRVRRPDPLLPQKERQRDKDLSDSVESRYVKTLHMTESSAVCP